MITITFLTNFVLGFVLAAEFGQVSVEILRRGLRYGLKQAILTSLGGTFADFIYLNIAITGTIYLLNRQGILKPLWTIGGIVVLYIAIKGIHKSYQINEVNTEDEETNPFMAGFLLNFLHPLNLIWWITILSSIIITDIQKYSVLTAYLNGTGIFFGVFAWWIILSLLISIARQWISIKILRFIGTGSFLTLVGFSLWFFYNAFTV